MRFVLCLLLIAATAGCPQSSTPDGDAGVDVDRTRDDAVALPPGEPAAPPEPSVSPGVEPEPGVPTDGGGMGPEPGPDDDGGTPSPDVDGGEPEPSDGGAEPEPEPEPVSSRYGVANVGEYCAPTQGTTCAAGLDCLLLYGEGGVCGSSCDTEGAACAGGVCTDFGLDDGTLVCGELRTSGATCDLVDLIGCEDGFECVGFSGDVNECRAACSCAPGEDSCQGGCAAGTCIPVNTTGEGLCGIAVNPGGACSPATDDTLCAGGICSLAFGSSDGTCRDRCSSDDMTCGSGTTCLMYNDSTGGCEPTTGRTHGEPCTTGSPGVGFTMSCALGFTCRDLSDTNTPGYGTCIEDCPSGTCNTLGASCYGGVPAAGGATLDNVCIVNKSLGEECSFPAFYCEADEQGCVAGTCKTLCTKSNCPNGACECSGGDVCNDLLGHATLGVCGTTAPLGATCDLDITVFCEPAPNESVAGNAFNACINNSCRMLCEVPNDSGVDVLACPAGMECVADPWGQLDAPLKVCATPVE